ncbi:MAG: peptidylprolyl isomerase [Chitinophagaceae bacterium]
MKKLGLLWVLCWAATSGLRAQSTMVGDKIVSIVGDRIILKSDVDGQYEQLKKEGNSLPPEQEAKCAILEQMMAQKALVLEAKRDSLPISDDEVEGDLDNRIQYFLHLYGSKQKLEEITGQTIYQIKENFREPIRENIMAAAMRKKIIDEVKITPTEVKDFFDHTPKDSLTFYPSEVEVGQIVINPKPSREMVDYAISQIKKIREEIVSGQETFQTQMILYSKDPGSLRNDGLFTITLGDKNMDPHFMEAAFRLQDGEISPVVKSQFGYHLIQMVKREGDNAQVRDLLIIPEITSEDIRGALNKLDTVRSDIIAGKISFGAAAVAYSDDPDAKLTAGMLTNQSGSTYLTIPQLDQGLVLMIDSLKPGDISRPMTFTNAQGNTAVRIIYLKSRSRPHQENLRDDYSRIQEKALQAKQYKALDAWFNKNIPTFYIMLDKQYQSCPNLEAWEKAEKTHEN